MRLKTEEQRGIAKRQLKIKYSNVRITEQCLGAWMSMKITAFSYSCNGLQSVRQTWHRNCYLMRRKQRPPAESKGV